MPSSIFGRYSFKQLLQTSMTEKFTKKTLKIINFTIKVKDKSQIFYEKTGPKKRFDVFNNCKYKNR